MIKVTKKKTKRLFVLGQKRNRDGGKSKYKTTKRNKKKLNEMDT